MSYSEYFLSWFTQPVTNALIMFVITVILRGLGTWMGIMLVPFWPGVFASWAFSCLFCFAVAVGIYLARRRK